MKIKQLAVLFLGVTLATQATAHNRWLLPTHFNLSSDKGEWVMVDATASNETFNVDKALSIDNLRIVTPAGESTRPSSFYRGHRKTVLDYFIKENGTYKIANTGSQSYMTVFKVDGERQRLWLSKGELAGKLPANATDVKTIQRLARVETYITMNSPSDNFTSDGRLLELVPVTHPSDIAEDEEVTFKLLFNGKPQKGIEVSILADGVRYRNDPNALTLQTNDQGVIRFTLENAGRYLLIAEHEVNLNNNPMADTQMGEVFLTFDAQLN